VNLFMTLAGRFRVQGLPAFGNTALFKLLPFHSSICASCVSMLAAVLNLVCHLFVPISHTTGEGTWHILLTCKNDVLSPEQGWDIMSVPMQGVDGK
jgi:hypothetical protein